MPYVERTDEEIVAAWEEWCKGHPNPDDVVFYLGEEEYSPLRTAEELRSMLEIRKQGREFTDNSLWIVCVEMPKKDSKEKEYDAVDFIKRKRQ